MMSQRRSTTHLPMPPSLRSLKAMTGSPLSRATSTTNPNRGFRKYARFSSLVESYRLPARTCPEVNKEGQTTLLGFEGEAEPDRAGTRSASTPLTTRNCEDLRRGCEGFVKNAAHPAS